MNIRPEFACTRPYTIDVEGKNRFGNQEAINKVDNYISSEILGLKVLIAEDDEISNSLITITVEKFSDKIIKTRTGFESIEACRKNPDIDLVLMDVEMPEMDGYKATEQIRQFNKGVIIIAQTAYGLSGDRERALESGCNDYIANPINITTLLELIQKYFN